MPCTVGDTVRTSPHTNKRSEQQSAAHGTGGLRPRVTTREQYENTKKKRNSHDTNKIAPETSINSTPTAEQPLFRTLYTSD